MANDIANAIAWILAILGAIFAMMVIDSIFKVIGERRKAPVWCVKPEGDDTQPIVYVRAKDRLEAWRQAIMAADLGDGERNPLAFTEAGDLVKISIEEMPLLRGALSRQALREHKLCGPICYTCGDFIEEPLADQEGAEPFVFCGGYCASIWKDYPRASGSAAEETQAVVLWRNI